MPVWSDMNGFPEGGFPVLANANDMITLGNLYLEPLRANNYVIDVLGNNRLAGALVIAGALSGCAGIAAGGAITGVTTIAANNTATLSHAIAPLTLSGADAVLAMTGANAILRMSGLNSSIGSVLERIGKAYFKKLYLDERPIVGEDLVALISDVQKVAIALSIHTHSIYEPVYTDVHLTDESGYTVSQIAREKIFVNVPTTDTSFSITFDASTDDADTDRAEAVLKVIAINTGISVTLEFGDKLDVTGANIVLTDADNGKAFIFTYFRGYWRRILLNG